MITTLNLIILFIYCVISRSYKTVDVGEEQCLSDS